jgi:23S rRNA (adenine2503-C2)-methyltransferase
VAKSHNLLNYDRVAMADFFEQQGEKAYRATQVFRRLHHDSPQSTDIFCDLPTALRTKLAQTTSYPNLPLASDHVATDGVCKLLFDVGGDRIETVIIPESNRTTLCVSSQVGCALACRFCLTGKQGFSRNLSTAEIISQLRKANRLLPPGKKITNVVFMGMGEPLLNLDAVLSALKIMIDTHGYALPPRRVTVSTAGVVPAMARLATLPVALAVSLHAPTDTLRDEIMPINRKYPLDTLMAACHRHILNRSRAFITFEYVMLDGVNDSVACARALIRLLHGLRCKVNLIPFNIFPDTPYQPSPYEAIDRFRDVLMRGGVMTTVRKTRGNDILAACGQLAGSVQARTMGLGSEKPLLRA